MTKQSKILAFLSLAGLGYFAIAKANENIESEVKESTMTNQQLYYGVKDDAEILAIINEVATKYAYSANVEYLKKMLFEIVATESDFGYAKDASRSYGEGLTQFDKTTYNELRNEILNRGENPYGLKDVSYETLRENPKVQIYMTRYFIYRRIPHTIPSTLEGRANDWKTYYNTKYGKGTVQHYITMSNKHYKRLGI